MVVVTRSKVSVTRPRPSKARTLTILFHFGLGGNLRDSLHHNLALCHGCPNGDGLPVGRVDVESPGHIENAFGDGCVQSDLTVVPGVFDGLDHEPLLHLLRGGGESLGLHSVEEGCGVLLLGEGGGLMRC